ncbi:MAG: hypothetical protein B6D61_14795 [Bacteroidetes bacterium 4484_249]|nr:MAG: hypothetical protein B6D61_14795 [Bacteroidetes bacterium 4484_249]
MEKRIITLFIFIVAGINSYAQFEVSGVIRPRMEYRNGYAKLRDSLTEAAFFDYYPRSTGTKLVQHTMLYYLNTVIRVGK